MVWAETIFPGSPLDPKEKPTYRGFILDTNIFNHLVKGEMAYEDLPKLFSLYVIPSQKIELEKWEPKDAAAAALKAKALAYLEKIPDAELQPKTAAWGFFRWGQARWGAKGRYFDEILKRLNEANGRKGDSNVHDSLIGEAALSYHLELVTDDKALARIVRDLGGRAFSLRKKTGRDG